MKKNFLMMIMAVAMMFCFAGESFAQGPPSGQVTYEVDQTYGWYLDDTGPNAADAESQWIAYATGPYTGGSSTATVVSYDPDALGFYVIIGDFNNDGFAEFMYRYHGTITVDYGLPPAPGGG